MSEITIEEKLDDIAAVNQLQLQYLLWMFHDMMSMFSKFYGLNRNEMKSLFNEWYEKQEEVIVVQDEMPF